MGRARSRFNIDEGGGVDREPRTKASLSMQKRIVFPLQEGSVRRPLLHIDSMLAKVLNGRGTQCRHSRTPHFKCMVGLPYRGQRSPHKNGRLTSGSSSQPYSSVLAVEVEQRSG